jgi:hypothetical protein
MPYPKWSPEEGKRHGSIKLDRARQDGGIVLERFCDSMAMIASVELTPSLDLAIAIAGWRD